VSTELERIIAVPTGRRPFWRVLDWEGSAGLLAVVFIVVIGVLGPLFAPYGPTQVAVGPIASGPSAQHLLGTDELGRDVLSRLLNGGLTTILVATLSVLVAYALGILIGFWSSSRGGWVDALIVRAVDVVVSLPYLLLVFAIVAIFGSSLPVVAVVLTVVFLPYIVRVTRGISREVYSRDYVQMAVLRGDSRARILFLEVLPNAAGPLLADCGQQLTAGVLTLSTLSYLGIGSQPPSSDWGAMVADGQSLIATSPLAAFAPALCVAMLCIGFNLIADSVRKRVVHADDPRSSGLSVGRGR
jgi:peptide/nickel transport system permease protein